MPFKAILKACSFWVIPSILLLLFFDLKSFWLFLSTFLLVFLLGFQSLTVNSKMYVLAIFNSFGIGMCNLYMLKVVPGMDPDNLVHVMAYLTGGPFGILTSMVVHFQIIPAIKLLKTKKKPTLDLVL